MPTNYSPRLRARESGGWLAVTDPADELRIGVTADTEGEARERFAEAVDAWARLLDKAAEVDHREN